MNNVIYLDHNATTPIRPAVAAAVVEALSVYGNASSVHEFGRRAKRVLEDAREQVAALVRVRPSQVIFTSGGTEANNLAVRGARVSQVFASGIEHVSVLQAAENLTPIPVDAGGRLHVDALAEMLKPGSGQRPDQVLVSVMYANNETGVLQPVQDVADVCQANGALFHCDAIQAAGKVPLDFADTGADLLSLSAHKIGGPQGVGALIVRDDIRIMPTSRGGGQELRRRAGTENLAGIAGFGVAAELAVPGVDENSRLAALRDQLEARLHALAPVQVFGADHARLGNTSCLSMPGVDAETQIMGLDIAGVAVSAGSACSSGKVEPSHVLQAMGIDARIARTAIRISFGWTSLDADVGRLVEAWADIYHRAGSVRPAAMAS